MRAPTPDISFDVLNYHIFHSERALHGPLLTPHDLFPTPAPFNPAPDILTGLYRHLLGYRLGTIANLLAVAWLGVILDRFLSIYVRRSVLRSVAVLLILCTEQIFFQINNYMVDLLALPLLMEATRLAVRKIEPAKLVRHGLVVALLLGISVTFKLANLAFAAPIALLLILNFIANIKQVRMITIARLIAIATVVFVAPLLPFSILIYRLTGNPVFPLYNAVFKSPYWPVTNMFDPRWGPKGVKETLLWPVLTFFEPERFCEFPVYSGRICLGVIAAVICLVLAKSDWAIRGLCGVTLVSALLWSFASGYSRYAIYIEITSGVLLVWLIHFLWKALSDFAWPMKWLPQFAVWLLLLIQASLSFSYANQYEWSMRGTIIAHRLPFTLREAGQIFRDRDLATYISPDDRASLNDVTEWVETTYKTTALMVLLKPDVPVIGVRTSQYFVNREGRDKFEETISAARGKRIFTLTDTANLQSAREALALRGLSTGAMRPISIPYFSESTKLDMLLVEVAPSARNGSDNVAPKGVPLPDHAFNSRLQISGLPLTLRAGEKYVVDVKLQNASDMRWPGQQAAWRYQITVGNRWLEADGTKLSDLDGRVALADDLAPGETTTLRLTITAPSVAGNYLLQVDAIQEDVAWFGDRGSTISTSKIKVE